MKYHELERKLKKAGCYMLQHRKGHDEWYNPKTGLKTFVPRHGTGEVPMGTLNSIIKGLGL